MIVFDEHLVHGSAGGTRRRQWRVDYVASPVDTESVARVRDDFAGIFAPARDGGYDVDRYPTYGEHWHASGRPWVEPPRALGVYDANSAEEAFARSRCA